MKRTVWEGEKGGSASFVLGHGTHLLPPHLLVRRLECQWELFCLPIFFIFSFMVVRLLGIGKPLDSNSTGVRTSPRDGLARRLGLFELVLIGVGASIGAGIFAVTGTVARDAGPGRI